MNYSSLKAIALVLLGASQNVRAQPGEEPVVISQGECLTSATAGFDYEVLPDDAEEGFLIRWSIDTAAETVSFEAVAQAAAWVGVGFSPDGMMIGADAVIGLPDDASVLEYEMTLKDVSGVLPFAEQEITGGSVSQDTSTTTLAFTRPLAPAGAKQALSAVPGDETILLWASGADNTLEFHGLAPKRGSVAVDLFCGAGAETMAPTPAPADTMTASPSSLEDGDGQDTDGAARAGGGGVVAAAAAGVVTALAALVL